MRRIFIGIVAMVLLGGGAAVAGDMTLARDGSLLRLASGGDGLMVSQSTADGTILEYMVPQTVGVFATDLQIAVDESSGTIVVAWQEDEGELARVLLATHNQGTWQGPVVVAGDGGVSASNPALLVHRTNTVVEEEEGPVEYSTAIVHLAWWEGLELESGGGAYYASAPLDDTGAVDWTEFAPIDIRELIPFGVGCDAIDDPSNLSHPRLFMDPETGDPHVLAVDVSNCLFQIIQLHPELGDDDGTTKRRRHITVLRHQALIGVNPDLPLESAKVEVGHGLQVAIHWDEDDTIHYVFLAEEGWTDERFLPFGESLSHERAVELIRGLAK